MLPMREGFHQNSDLINHMMIHTEEKPYECSQSDKAFTSYSYLENHTKIDIGKNTYELQFTVGS